MNNTLQKFTYSIFTFTFLTYCLYSCSEDDNSVQNNIPENAVQFSSFDEIQNELKTEPEKFIFQPNENIELEGGQGSKIFIYKDAFTDNDGDIYIDEVTAQFQEFLTLDMMIKNDIQTVSDNKPLVTAGSFYLNFKDIDGNNLNVDRSKLAVQLQIKTDISNHISEMQYFTGSFTNQNNSQIFNWVPEPNGFIESIDSNIAYLFNINPGFSNIDSFPQEFNNYENVNFYVNYTDQQNIEETETWFIINNYPIVYKLIYNDIVINNGFKTFRGLPENSNGILITYARDDNGYLKFGIKNITVSKDSNYEIELDYGTIDELKTLLQNLTTSTLQ